MNEVLQIVEEFTFDEFLYSIYGTYYNIDNPGDEEVAQYLFDKFCQLTELGNPVSKQMIFDFFEEWEFFTTESFARWCWNNRIKSCDVEYFKCETVDNLYFVHIP